MKRVVIVVFLTLWSGGGAVAQEGAAPGSGSKPATAEDAKKLLKDMIKSDAKAPAQGSDVGLSNDQKKTFDKSMKGFADDLGKQLTEYGRKVADDVRRELEKQANDPKTKESVERVQRVIDEAQKKAAADEGEKKVVQKQKDLKKKKKKWKRKVERKPKPKLKPVEEEKVEESVEPAAEPGK